jgi:hypothetical protein
MKPPRQISASMKMNRAALGCGARGLILIGLAEDESILRKAI